MTEDLLDTFMECAYGDEDSLHRDGVHLLIEEPDVEITPEGNTLGYEKAANYVYGSFSPIWPFHLCLLNNVRYFGREYESMPDILYY